MPPGRPRLDRSRSGSQKGSRLAISSPANNGVRTPSMVRQYSINYGSMSEEEIERAQERLFQPCRVLVKDFFKNLKFAPANGFRDGFSVSELDGIRIADIMNTAQRSSVSRSSGEKRLQSTNSGSVERNPQNSAGDSVPVVRYRSPRGSSNTSVNGITDPDGLKSIRAPSPSGSEEESANDCEDEDHKVARGSQDRGRSREKIRMTDSLDFAGDSLRKTQNSARVSARLTRSGLTVSRNVAKRTGHLIDSANDSVHGPVPCQNLAKSTGPTENSANDSVQVAEPSRNVAKHTVHLVNSANDSVNGPTKSRNVGKRSRPKANSENDSMEESPTSRNVAKRTGPKANSANDSVDESPTSRNVAKRTGPLANSVEESPTSRKVVKPSGQLANSVDDSVNESSPTIQNVADQVANTVNGSTEESPTSRNVAKRTGHKANSSSDFTNGPRNVAKRRGRKPSLASDSREMSLPGGCARVGVASRNSSRLSQRSPARPISASEFSVRTPPPNQQSRTVTVRSMATQTEDLEDLMLDLLNAVKCEYSAKEVEPTPEFRPPSSKRRSSSATRDSRAGGASSSVGSSVPILSPVSPHCSRTIPIKDLILRKQESRVIQPSPRTPSTPAPRTSTSPAAKPKRKVKAQQPRESEVLPVPAAQSESIGEVLDQLLPEWPRAVPCPKSKKKFAGPKSVKEQREAAKSSESAPNVGESSSAAAVESSNLEDDTETFLQVANEVVTNNQKRKISDESPSKIVESRDRSDDSESPGAHSPMEKRIRSSESAEIIEQLNLNPESLSEHENQPLESEASVREEVNMVTVQELVIPPPTDSFEDLTLARDASPAPGSPESPISDHSYALDPTPKRLHKGKIFAALRKELLPYDSSSTEIGSESRESPAEDVDISTNTCKIRLTRGKKVKEVVKNRAREEEEEESLELARIGDFGDELRESRVVDVGVGKVRNKRRKSKEHLNELVDNDAEDEELSMILKESERVRSPSPQPTDLMDFFKSADSFVEESESTPLAPLPVKEDVPAGCKKFAIRLERLSDEKIRELSKPRPPSVPIARETIVSETDVFDALDFEVENDVRDSSPIVSELASPGRQDQPVVEEYRELGGENIKESREESGVKTKKSKEKKSRKKSGDSKTEDRQNRSKSQKSRKKKERQGSTSKSEKSSSVGDSKASKPSDSMKASQKDQENPSTSTGTQDLLGKIVKGSDLKPLGAFKIPKKPRVVPVIKQRCLPKIPILDRLVPKVPERRESPDSVGKPENEPDYSTTVEGLIESAILKNSGASLESSRPEMRTTSTEADDFPGSLDPVTPAVEERERSPEIPVDPVTQNQPGTTSEESSTEWGFKSKESEFRIPSKRVTCARFARSWDTKDRDDSDDDLESRDDLESIRGYESPKSFIHRNEIVELARESPDLSPKRDECDFLEISAEYDDIDLGIGESSITEHHDSVMAESHGSTGPRSPTSNVPTLFVSPDSSATKPPDSSITAESAQQKCDNFARVAQITTSPDAPDSSKISKPEISRSVPGLSLNPVKVSQPTLNRTSAPTSTPDSTRQIPNPKPLNNPVRQLPFRPYQGNDSNVPRPCYPVQNRQESFRYPEFLPKESHNVTQNSKQPLAPLKKVGICIVELRNPGTCRRPNCLQHFSLGAPNLGQLILDEVNFWMESKDVDRFRHAQELILKGAFVLTRERLQVSNLPEYQHKLVRIIGQKLLQVRGLEALLQFFEPTSQTLMFQERFFAEILTNKSQRPLLSKEFERFAQYFCTTDLKFGSNGLDAVLDMAVSHAPGMLRNCIRKAMAKQPGYCPSPTALNDLLLQALSNPTEQTETARLLGSLPSVTLANINSNHLRSFCRCLEQFGSNLPIELRGHLQILNSVAISLSSDPASTGSNTPKACATVRPQNNREGTGNFGQYQTANYFGAPPRTRNLPELLPQDNRSNEVVFRAPVNRMRTSTGQETFQFRTDIPPPSQYQQVSSSYRLAPVNGSPPDPRLVPGTSQRQPQLPVPSSRPVPISTSRVESHQQRPAATNESFGTVLSVPGTSGPYRPLQESMPVPARHSFTIPAVRSNLPGSATRTVMSTVPATANTRSVPAAAPPVYIPTPKSQLPPPPSNFELPEGLSESTSSPDSQPSLDLEANSPANGSSSILPAPGPNGFREPEVIMTLLTLRQFNDLARLLKEAPPHRLDQIGNSIARYYEELINQKSSNVTADFIKLVTSITSCSLLESSEDVERILATVASTIFARFADHELEFLHQANMLMRDCCNKRQWPVSIDGYDILPYGLCNPVMMELLQVECWIQGGDYLEAAEVLKDLWDGPMKNRMTDLDLKREAETLVRLCHQLIELARVGVNKHRSLRAWAMLYHTFSARTKIPVELYEALPELVQLADETNEQEAIAGMVSIMDEVAKKNLELHGDIDDTMSVLTIPEDDD